MPCQSPLRQYHAASGWSFNPAKPHTEFRDLDCGVCIECRIRKSREWVIRCYHESQLHDRSCWVTLSYADSPVALIRRDVQLFFKSLRNAGRKFRYFGCGEYGEESLRPHYHIILFGTDFPDMYPWRRTKKGHILYRSPTLEKHWTLGHAEIGHVTAESARYTAGYTYKKLNGPAADEADEETGLRHYDRMLPDGTVFEVPKEMLFCSKRPAIGLEWFLKYGREVYPADIVVMNGKEYKPPKYYDKLMKEYAPHVWEEVAAARVAHVAENEINEDRREAICKSREANRKAKGDKRNAL